jgi:hypothetical protein
MAAAGNTIRAVDRFKHDREVQDLREDEAKMAVSMSEKDTIEDDVRLHSCREEIHFISFSRSTEALKSS